MRKITTNGHKLYNGHIRWRRSVVEKYTCFQTVIANSSYKFIHYLNKKHNVDFFEIISSRSPMAEATDLKSVQVWVRIPPGAKGES